MSQRKSTLRSPKKNRPSISAMDQFDPTVVMNEQLHGQQMTISNQEIEIERLKTTVIALNTKCTVVDDHKLDVDQHYEKYTSSETQRGYLHTTITKTREDVNQQQIRHQDYQQELHSTIIDVNSNLELQKQQQFQREEDHRNEKDQLDQKHYNTSEQLNGELNRRTKEHNEIYEQTTNDLTNQRENLRTELTNKHVEMENRLNAENERIRLEHQTENENTRTKLQAQNQKERDELQNENQRTVNELQNDHHRKQTELQNENQRKVSELQNENQRTKTELQNENQRLRDQLQAENNKIRTELQKKLDDQELHYNTLLTETKNKMAADHENTRKSLTDHNERERSQLTKDREDLRTNLTGQMESLRKYHVDDHEKTRLNLTEQMEAMRIEKDNRHNDLEVQHEQLRKNNTEQITKHEMTINTITDHKLDHDNTIIGHEQTIHHQKDVHDQHMTAQEQIQQLLSQKDTLQDELHNSADYILELEEKVYKANKTSLELLKQLKDAEVEIETLKQYIIDLKQRIAVYIPVKADSTDKKLAEFINNYPERSKLKIMFMRESEGVYQFGTKKVAVKVEKDNIKIRVGGGYLSIDEFLDQYTPVELEKLERKDPLKRFSEKVAIQKTIVNQAVRENSPVRNSSPGGRRSPGKQAV